MEIEEVKKLKKEFEDKLKATIEKFNNETGMLITEITINNFRGMEYNLFDKTIKPMERSILQSVYIKAELSE